MCACHLHTWQVHVNLFRWYVQSKNAQQEEGAQSASIKDTEHLCSHLRTISINFDAVEKHFPDYFHAEQQADEKNDENVQDEEENLQFQQYDNNDDLNIALETEGNFDNTTGLWKFKSETTHKPMEQFDVNLIKHT